MKTILFTLFILFVSCAVSNAQFELIINKTLTPESLFTTEVGDTLNLGRKTNVKFEVYAIASNGDTLQNMYYKCDYGDEYGFSSTSNTFSHTYTEAGGFRAVIYALNKDDSTFVYEMIPIRVADDPTFEGTGPVSDLATFCDGENITLEGIAEPTTTLTEANPSFKKTLSKTLTSVGLESEISINPFDKDKRISDATQLESVCMTFLHKSVADISIKLVAPDGKEIVLKDSTMNLSVFAGRPREEHPDSVDVTYKYCFVDDASLETMKNSYQNYVYTYAGKNQYYLPKGDYKTQQSYADLVGSPFLGFWRLEIESQKSDKSKGYIDSWEMNWKESLFSDWTYDNFYTATDSSWTGQNAGKTNVNGSTENKYLSTVVVKPEGVGAHTYTYTVIDNWGFLHSYDKTEITVAEPSFTYTGPTGETVHVGEEITFSSTTDWGVNYFWDLADGSTKDTKETTLLYTYLDNKGFDEDKTKTYNVQLIAVSESGCKDTVKQDVKISLWDYDFDKANVNVFSPSNGDGINDSFKFVFDNFTSQFKAAELHIYNRWGKKIWKSKDTEEIAKGWDGKTNLDKDVPPGMYFFFVKFQTRDDVWHEENGNFYVF